MAAPSPILDHDPQNAGRCPAKEKQIDNNHKFPTGVPIVPPGPFLVSFDIPVPEDEARRQIPKALRKHTARGKPQSDTFTVYVDGSSLDNPGPAGWAAIIIGGKAKRVEKVGGEAYATNNMMELRASIEALKILPEGAKGILRSDSRYIVDGVNVHRKLWEQRGWRNSTGKPVKNAVLWAELFALVDLRPAIKFEWVQAHGNDRENAHADLLARTEAQRQRMAVWSREGE